MLSEDRAIYTPSSLSPPPPPPRHALQACFPSLLASWLRAELLPFFVEIVEVVVGGGWGVEVSETGEGECVVGVECFNYFSGSRHSEGRSGVEIALNNKSLEDEEEKEKEEETR